MTDQTETVDHRTVLAALPPAARADFTERRDEPGLLRLGLHLGAILILGAVIAAKPPWWGVLLPIQGVLIVFLFCLLHEAIHGTAFRTSWVNTAAARIAAFALMLPPDWFRYFHLAHHRHTQDPAHDPELAAPWPTTWRAYLWRVSGLPVWADHVKTLVRNARGRCDDDYVPPAGRTRVRREARLMLAGYAAVASLAFGFGAQELIWVWIVPALLGQPFLRLYLMAEHGRCPLVANMLENTRTTFTTSLVRLLAWNMPYHAEHHSLPAAPFHRLPDLHARMAAHLRETERGYARFHLKTAARLSHSRGA
ncbi:fatty acid desaturase [Pikeienuella piscinae]|uniref:Fatty acid desaturase n=1 Tax=Pikeienuella piscinae TaxID=2748098 RepID=A0A7L5BSW3_9RHOB|nr:fatty acid desaturase [Pikeienuella piscinae]QIE54820.1 fatty acid desaturase [Pikeienuella piscinae]